MRKMKDKAHREQNVEKAAGAESWVAREKIARSIGTLTFILSLTGSGEEQNRESATD
jgi:hypothetical protein